MKCPVLFLAIVTGLGLSAGPLRSDDAAPDAAPDGAAPAVPAPTPIPPIPKGTPIEMLQAIRDANVKLLEQQAATLQKLEELEKTSQTVKTLSKRT